MICRKSEWKEKKIVEYFNTIAGYKLNGTRLHILRLARTCRKLPWAQTGDKMRSVRVSISPVQLARILLLIYRIHEKRWLSISQNENEISVFVCRVSFLSLFACNIFSQFRVEQLAPRCTFTQIENWPFDIRNILWMYHIRITCAIKSQRSCLWVRC